MNKKSKKTGMKYLHPLGGKLEKVMDVMREVQSSLDSWKVANYDISSPGISAHDDTDEIQVVALVGDEDFVFSVEDFVNRSFDILECGDHAYADTLIEFRRQFDEAVLKRFGDYENRSDPEEVKWAKDEMAIYKKELDGRA